MAAESRRFKKEKPKNVHREKSRTGKAKPTRKSVAKKSDAKKVKGGLSMSVAPAGKKSRPVAASRAASRRLSQGRVKQTDKKYLNIIEAIQDGYFELDLAGNFTFVNESLSKNIGYPRAELIGMNYRQYTDPENAEKLFQIFHKLFLTGEPAGIFDCEVIRKDGQKAFAEISLSLIRDTKGKPAAFCGTSRDVAERRKFIEDLRASEERHRTILENMQEGYFETDLEGRLTFVSDSVCAHLGYAREELIGAPPGFMETGTGTQKTSQAFWTVYKTGKPVKALESELIRKDGSRGIYELSIDLMRDLRGTPVGFRGVCHDVTERVNTREAIRASEQRHRTILENMQEGYFEVDLEGRLTFINDSVCKNLGYSREELIGTTNRFVQDETGSRITLQAYRRLYKTGIPVKALECELIRKDGSRGTFELSVDMIRDSRGKPVGYRGVSRDITERKQMENELRRSEERYRNIIETIQDAYIEIDLSGRWTFINHVVCEHLQYTREELIGVHYSKMQPDESSAKRLYNIFSQIYQTGQPVKALEMAGVRKDGTIGTYEFSVSLMRDAAGKPTGFRCVSRDITDRKRMENELRQSEERYRSIIETMADGYIEVDLRGNWTFFNDVITNRMGYTREELLKADFHTLHTPASAKRAVKGFLQVYQTGQPIKALEVETVKKNGSTGFYELSVSLMRDADGKPVGFRCISRDINERKRAEEELLRINRELQEATARANELAAKAEAANIAKSEFLANMSHEIRTPMNGVIGMIGLLADMGLSEEQRRYAEIARANGELLLELINNILDFSKMEARKLKLESLDFDLLALLDDFTATMALPAQEKGLEFLCSVDLDVPTRLRGDPGRLRQILTNLVGNAVKFTRVGEVVVTVSLAGEPKKIQTRNGVPDQSDVLLRFSVRDTGIGIPEGKIGLLFNKFSQVDASTTRQYGGSGLGLVISRELSELFGGDTGVISEEGKGSEFWFTARLGLQTEAQQAQCLPADLRGMRVLIVDDNATNREILATRLASWGMRTSESKDGQSALQAVYQALDENDPFRMALIDMQMPHMDGETLGKIIRMDDRLADTCLVLLTSLGTRGDIRRFQEEGFAAYVTKPIKHQEFKTILSMALSGSREMREPMQQIVTQHTIKDMSCLFAGRKARILVAEDNVTNQQVALGLLKRLGLRADAVANGLEVINAMETIPYDLILMDVQMPELDGFEATRRIRRWKDESGNDAGHHRAQFRKRASKIPIIAMTAYAMEGDRDRCLEAGMNDYVSKPVSRKALADALGKWLPKEDADIGAASFQSGEAEAGGHNGECGPEHKAQVFNREDMLDRLGDEKLARKVALRFIENIPIQIQALKDHLKDGDASSAHRVAHSLKSAAASIGGEVLSAVAREMEQTSMEGDMEGIRSRLPDLEMRFEQLRQAVSKTLLS